MKVGSLHQQAKELRVESWIDGAGIPTARPLKLSDVGDGYNIIFCFQHWCPGCHSRGFPALQVLYKNLKDKGVGFAVIQTVFEGAHTNTFDKLRRYQRQYELDIPFGHDVPPDNGDYPTFMEDYRTGGTPWFTIIDRDGTVVFADFRLDPAWLLSNFDPENVEFSAA